MRKGGIPYEETTVIHQRDLLYKPIVSATFETRHVRCREATVAKYVALWAGLVRIFVLDMLNDLQILHHILVMLTLHLSLGTSRNLPLSRELPANRQLTSPL